jgi:hypothetical protein
VTATLTIPDGALAKQSIFERGDRIYLTTPVQIFRPSDDQIEEYAFSKAVKTKAPNDNIVWFKGQYVEADNPNGNGAMWNANELAIKALTPMLMPVTVMHDPRTAVGTIADVAMKTPEKDGVPRARIDTVLALWGHRFPDAVAEAEANASQGTLMQSMECFSPWYECSVCSSVFHKLPLGAERAMWCDHLKASNPSGGYVASQSQNASRILGAYSEAYLENFGDELANLHQSVHTATVHTTPPRSEPRMGLVQIEDSELATLRRERDEAKAEAAKLPELQTKLTAAEQAAETAEAAKVAAEQERDTVKTEVAALKEKDAQAELKDQRIGALGDGFKAKLDSMPTVKARLDEQAKSMSDEDWDGRLKEIEEIAQVKRDATKEGGTTPPPADDGTFSSEELASLKGIANGPDGTPSRDQIGGTVRSLASAFKPQKS